MRQSSLPTRWETAKVSVNRRFFFCHLTIAMLIGITRQAISEIEVNKVTKDLSVTESAFEKIKIQLGFDKMSLAEIEQKLLERREISEATDVAGGAMGRSRSVC
jgi:hypothetical protein